MSGDDSAEAIRKRLGPTDEMGLVTSLANEAKWLRAERDAAEKECEIRRASAKEAGERIAALEAEVARLKQPAHVLAEAERLLLAAAYAKLTGGQR